MRSAKYVNALSQGGSAIFDGVALLTGRGRENSTDATTENPSVDIVVANAGMSIHCEKTVCPGDVPGVEFVHQQSISG